MPCATSQTALILITARGLLATAMPMIDRRGVTLVGIAVANLENADAVQLVLPFDRRSRDALDAALDEVRAKYGSTAVIRAVLLGHGDRPPPPLLPD
jgi:DNA polymerase-4